jgi:ATP-dependent Clp protease ATP-binding subunit ClpC
MSHFTYNSRNPRIAKSRLGRYINPWYDKLLQAILGLSLFGVAALAAIHNHLAFSLAGVALIISTALIWVRRDVRTLPPAALGTSTALDALLPADLAAAYREPLTTPALWSLIGTTGDAGFLMQRFGLPPENVTAGLSTWQVSADDFWTETVRICQSLGLETIRPAAAFCALFTLNPALDQLLTAHKLSPQDLIEGAGWLARLDTRLHAKKPIYGGIARDWASGFTPTLSKFGTNISQQVEWARGGLSTQERTGQLDALVTGLNGATGSVVLIGEPGIGKSALLLGLSERLLRGIESGELKHHQIYSLSASSILAGAQGPGDIENIVLTILSEAISADNIVVALDEAQLFFGQGTGAVNLSQVLLPILQNRSLKLILAITPGDWQRLKATNSAMASLLTPLVLTEATQTDTLRILADRAFALENGRLITTWEALLEAYRLSGRYFEDEAYPGRALKLLEAAGNFPDGAFISEKSVQQAIESEFGVKVQTAGSTETDVLLHLEDKIHERMINQVRAVSVIANALRRARAGVANPHRPIGSFLFLGPTGVGKTELAKSLAALYFNDEHSLIRLDMSEYQQIADVDRILESAADNPAGLLPRVRQQPFSVVLFDEIEKAHPNILNLFLQLLDEGNLTDTAGHPTSFKDAIVIATSNAGADDIRAHIEAGEPLESFEQPFINGLIDSGAFRPELLNRFDEIVVFRPLNQAELAQVVHLMVVEVNKTLANQKITVELSDDAAAELARVGYDPRLGARPMRRMVQRRVEDAVAGRILRGEAKPGDIIHLDASGLAPGNISPSPGATGDAPADAVAADAPDNPMPE